MIDLAKLKRLEAAATPGPWYAHATDDRYCMNARYVGVRKSDFSHDNLCGLSHKSLDQEPPQDVIAITLLQMPNLATNENCDENTEFIASIRNAAPELFARIAELDAEVERLSAALDALRLAKAVNNRGWMVGDPLVTDGFGNYWPATCLKCGAPMQVVRPGDCRCSAECYLDKE